jgi:uridine phosphorylase
VSAPEPDQICPLLEYDPDPTDVVTAAQPATPRASVAPAAVLAYLGDATNRWAAEHGYERVTSVRLLGQKYPVYVGAHGATPLTLVEMPLGAPASAIVADDVFRMGARVGVAVGSCGGLVHFAEGEFVLPDRALRDEGTSWHYAPPGRWIDTDPAVRAAIARACEAAGYAAVTAPAWTTDAFFRETRAKVEARRAEGCRVVDMECAALAAVARHRGARFAQLLFTADTLAGGAHDARGWGRSAHETALRLALDAAAAAPLA